MERVQALLLARFGDAAMAAIVMSSPQLMAFGMRLATLTPDAARRLAAADGVLDAVLRVTEDVHTFQRLADDPAAIDSLVGAIDAVVDRGEMPTAALLASITKDAPAAAAARDDDDDDMYDSTRTYQSGLTLLGATLRARRRSTAARALAKWLRLRPLLFITVKGGPGPASVVVAWPVHARVVYAASGLDAARFELYDAARGAAVSPAATLRPRGAADALVLECRPVAAPPAPAAAFDADLVDALSLFAVWDHLNRAQDADLATAWRRWRTLPRQPPPPPPPPPVEEAFVAAMPLAAREDGPARAPSPRGAARSSDRRSRDAARAPDRRYFNAVGADASPAAELFAETAQCVLFARLADFPEPRVSSAPARRIERDLHRLTAQLQPRLARRIVRVWLRTRKRLAFEAWAVLSRAAPRRRGAALHRPGEDASYPRASGARPQLQQDSRRALWTGGW
ncbi:hypothetical protein M885DRAFT_563745 [Pelagophyceae sp. CCMP2097]|nr:hypothetical protein M885DRAFT_563745 [Pelagophyceae sp. CCMP2097]